MTEYVDSTITFPYKRSLGPMLQTFMTALTEQAHPRDPQRRRRAGPADGVGPGDGGRAGAGLRRGRSGRHRRVVDVGARADRAAPARPPLRLRLHPAGRRDHAAAPRRRRRVARRHERRPPGRAPVEGPASRAHQRPRLLRPRRGAGGRRRGRRAPRRARDPHGLRRHDHLPEPGAAVGRAGGRCLPRAPDPRQPVPGVRADVLRRSRLLPDRRHRARPRDRGRPAPHRHDHQLQHHHADPVPGADGDRAVRAGLRPHRRQPT